MRITLSRMLSLGIGAVYVIMYARSAWPIDETNVVDIMLMTAVVMCPVAMIWFPEEIGAINGYIGHTARVTTESPPFLIAGIGWLVLVGVPVVILALDGC